MQISGDAIKRQIFEMRPRRRKPKNAACQMTGSSRNRIMSLTLYLDCCALQRPFDDRVQMRIALESEAVLQVLERVQLGSLKLVKSAALQLEIN